MSEDIWSAQDTTPDAIDAALRSLLHERHLADEALVPARVLNLVVIVDRDWKGEISNRLGRVGRYHASRTVLCAVEQGRTKLDARAVMSYQDEHNGLGVIVEQVEIDLGQEHLEALRTIIDTVIVAELPTVLWAPHGHEEAVQALLDMIDVMLLDSDDVLEPKEGLARARNLLKSGYVVDLAWLRTTPWRERLAASFDLPRRRGLLRRLDNLAVRHRQGSMASAMLLAGWLASRLDWQQAELELVPVDQEAPGLAGVSVACDGAFALSLDRGKGGLRAVEREGAQERIWQVLGASRGEGGILGEGVRQALLRDPTYGPALDAALELCT